MLRVHAIATNTCQLLCWFRSPGGRLDFRYTLSRVVRSAKGTYLLVYVRASELRAIFRGSPALENYVAQQKKFDLKV